MGNEVSGPSEANVRFISAMQLVRSEFLNYVEECVNSWWPARSIVEAAFDKAAAIDPSQQIIKLGQTCPWQAHIFTIEEAKEAKGVVKYVIFQDVKGAWRVQAVPTEEGSFANRKPLPVAWRGLKEEGVLLMSLSSADVAPC